LLGPGAPSKGKANRWWWAWEARLRGDRFRVQGEKPFSTVMGDGNEALLNALWQEWPNAKK
jgi:hypothetical protein